jgi:hypothetical protein
MHNVGKGKGKTKPKTKPKPRLPQARDPNLLRKFEARLATLPADAPGRRIVQAKIDRVRGRLSK